MRGGGGQPRHALQDKRGGFSRAAQLPRSRSAQGGAMARAASSTRAGTEDRIVVAGRGGGDRSRPPLFGSRPPSPLSWKFGEVADLSSVRRVRPRQTAFSVDPP